MNNDNNNIRVDLTLEEIEYIKVYIIRGYEDSGFMYDGKEYEDILRIIIKLEEAKKEHEDYCSFMERMEKK